MPTSRHLDPTVGASNLETLPSGALGIGHSDGRKVSSFCIIPCPYSHSSMWPCIRPKPSRRQFEAALLEYCDAQCWSIAMYSAV